MENKKVKLILIYFYPKISFLPAIKITIINEIFYIIFFVLMLQNLVLCFTLKARPYLDQSQFKDSVTTYGSGCHIGQCRSRRQRLAQIPPVLKKKMHNDVQQFKRSLKIKLGPNTLPGRQLDLRLCSLIFPSSLSICVQVLLHSPKVRNYSNRVYSYVE